MTEVLWLVVVLAVLALAVAGAASAVARSRDRRNRVVPEVPTRAPASWAGAHTPEARLHRRLRDLVAGLRSAPAVDAHADLRATLEAEALALDERLVSAAALPPASRAEPIVALEQAVGALEATAAELIATAATPLPGAGSDAVAERLRLLAEARAELDRVAGQPPTTPGSAAGA